MPSSLRESGDVYQVRQETAAVTLTGQNFNKVVLMWGTWNPRAKETLNPAGTILGL